MNKILRYSLLAMSAMLLSSCAKEKAAEQNVSGKSSAEPEKMAADSARTDYKVGDFSFQMVDVEGGTFKMGTSGNDEGYYNARPSHEVTVDGFLIMQTEVTAGLYDEVMGLELPERSKAVMAMTGISYDKAAEFIERLDKLTGQQFRLPTEAEWEWAARGGKKSIGTDYAGSNNPSEVAVYLDNSLEHPAPVATKAANSLGIYDMSGNACELCQDFYSPSYYSESPSRNPKGPAAGRSYVLRGGSYQSEAEALGIVVRDSIPAGQSREDAGIRLVLDR